MKLKSLIKEMININIKIGDVVLGGKFLNKRIIVKSIGKNAKDDITINNRPLLRYRILPKQKEGKEMKLKQMLNEQRDSCYETYVRTLRTFESLISSATKEGRREFLSKLKMIYKDLRVAFLKTYGAK